MFFGRYDYTIDTKGRLNFPAKFRDAMGESFVVLEWVDSCLFALPMEEVQRLADKLESDELMDSWAISGDLFSTACEVVPDKQGRILLPAELRAYAGLEKDVTIIGNRNHAEIWATEVWKARRAAAQAAPLMQKTKPRKEAVPMAFEEQQPFDPASFEHIPVLLNECLTGLAIDPAGTYLDGTAGGAGHSRQIALRLDAAKGGRLISLDQDPDAVQTARSRLAGLPATVVQINFRYAGQALEQLGIEKINGALLDLGVSSHQLDDAARGFSYRADAPLDMRMSQQGETAADLVNTESREDLARILRDYGEEPYAWQIAGKIVEARETAPILTTLQLADIVASAMPPAERRKNKNPSRRTFQALRIAVNHELDALEEGLDTIFDHLAPGGRLCVITFHSLEDRLVKNKFRRWSTACTCPPEFPVCICGGKAKAKLITRKPIEADTQELEENRRCRSAHLRVLEKC